MNTMKNIRIREGFILREMGGEFHVFDNRTGDSSFGSVVGMPSLNETCCYLWSRLERGVQYDQMIEEVAERNDEDEFEAEGDVQEFLAKLINGGIVEMLD